MTGGQKKATLLIVFGIVISAIPFLLRAHEKGRTMHYIDSFKQDDIQKKDIDKNEKKKNKEKREDEKNVSSLSEESVIGIIEIPSLHIEYPIFEGTGKEQLKEGIGHVETSTPLCEKGNCVLAGHNGSSRGFYFTFLSSIETGAVVRITNENKIIHEYKVQEMRTVDPYSSWVTEESDTELLTLFTCANHGNSRFVVKCISSEDY